MNKTLIAMATTVTLTLIGMFAVAHSMDDQHVMGDSNSNMMQLNHMNAMHHQMMNGSEHMTFDTTALTKELNLSNEQAAILSTLEANHIVMQEIINSKMSEHQQGTMVRDPSHLALMEGQHALYQQFEASLTEQQLALWENANNNCSHSQMSEYFLN